MKITTLAIAGAVMLGGCAAGDVGPTKLPKDAYGAMWSAKPADTVAACLSQARLIPRYEARQLNKMTEAGYQTIVVAKKQAWASPAEAANYSNCL